MGDAVSAKSMYHLSVDGAADRDAAAKTSPTPSHYSGAEEVDVEMIAEDISALDQRHRRYLLQKFATLWLNKIKPGNYASARRKSRGIFGFPYFTGQFDA